MCDSADKVRKDPPFFPFVSMSPALCDYGMSLNILPLFCAKKSNSVSQKINSMRCFWKSKFG